MMNIADPKYLQYLRGLPSSYLLDLLIDDDEGDTDSIIWVLLERGLTREQIEQKRQTRSVKTWTRPYFLWSAARWLTSINALIVTYFNMTGLYKLLQDDHIFKGPLLFLVVGSIIVGFIVGFKLTTHVYHGSKHFLYCGFPFPVGLIELKTGEEVTLDKPLMNIRMAINAVVGVSLTLFPLVFIYINMT